ncbi:helix-turn-helix domain-containing protein [Paenibacillus sp. 481]|uniref:helix-turn-helix domain-containing protein n=1 Tax=Paenibacillus sp. 481 TaxID=2835869 RepID=UPI001E420532|nr:helix-turn-helix transcriptional regulator [Paenibacillus sp. 481]UHA72149.1 helix-turn-helix domain-containing protein [Paenibacillus sp. 481]
MSHGSQHYLTIGDLLRQRRTEAGLSIRQLEELSNVAKGHISKLENNEVKRPEFSSIYPLARALNIPFKETVEYYIKLAPRAVELFRILEMAIKDSDNGLSTKIAYKYLQAPQEDSYTSVTKLYNITAAEVDPTVKLGLFKVIIEYSRDHGVMPYLAKSLYQEYLIERNDFNKLHLTYQNGKYVLRYVDFLPPEERLLLYYKLGIHAYNLRLFQDSILFCSKVIEENYSDGIVRAYSTGIICTAYYHLEEYDLSKKYLLEYSGFSYDFVKDNVTLMTAVLEACLGDREIAIKQLRQFLPTCGDNVLLHTVNQLAILLLDNNDLDEVENVLNLEHKILTLSCNTPFKCAQLALFYKLKGDYFIARRKTDEGINYYFESAHRYFTVNDSYNESECIGRIIGIYINEGKGMDISTLKKLDAFFRNRR